MKRFILFIAMCIATTVASYAQEPSKVEVKVNELVKRYEGVKGVECMTVAKGGGLELIKMLFNKQFGREFMKGVTSITIINYAEATNEVCQALHQELDAIASHLEEFKLNKNENAAEYSYARSLATVSTDGTISDFITAFENNEAKIMMYMAGKIKVVQ